MSAELSPAEYSPSQAREFFRHNVRPSSGYAHGYAQANLLSIPARDAFDFLLFAQRNPKPCPLLGVLEAGEVTSPLLDGHDIRDCLPSYRVFHHGELHGTYADVHEHWREDLVTFLIGCSFTFESALIDNGIRVAHIDQGCNVPMYRTTRPTTPAGRFCGPLVVSMRPIPAHQVSDAVRITSRYPAVHGAPVHIGDPAALGIDDLSAPDYGDAVKLHDGDVPVFWACGVTPQAVLAASTPEFAITHTPGHMLVTNARDLDYQIP
ncbi:putative hydro-lyase [Corynebacterium yudongzhengii]|uniref:Putative hydro-lyase DF222_05840 n=1 Tax=Corynebacterium yudongzhengii TaxID=2080740 RepID=A0A2U1T6K7_9CORY|nr:putative hydro-lyase [Corynebacterium yudongzhengii]AWB82186.1 putative hydro-lyase [Corynebacterium yudongzhengii]PWC01637.1 putative hydro-lyase [Corynebacterium yudongzhengii]